MCSLAGGYKLWRPTSKRVWRHHGETARRRRNGKKKKKSIVRTMTKTWDGSKRRRRSRSRQTRRRQSIGALNRTSCYKLSLLVAGLLLKLLLLLLATADEGRPAKHQRSRTDTTLARIQKGPVFTPKVYASTYFQDNSMIEGFSIPSHIYSHMHARTTHTHTRAHTHTHTHTHSHHALANNGTLQHKTDERLYSYRPGCPRSLMGQNMACGST